MKVIFAGSRGIPYQDVEHQLQDWWHGVFPFWPLEVVSGMCPNSPDMWAKDWADDKGIPVKEFPADWKGPLGKGAGYARNVQMADYADALIAFWDGKSKGTRHMIDSMLDRAKPIHVEIVYNKTTIS